MTQQAQAEALQVAELFEQWAKVRGENEAGSHTRGARELRRLHARVQELEAQKAAVQMPVPDAYLYVNGAHRGVSLEWRSDSDLAEGTERHSLYAGQQVRAMVAEQAAPGWKLVPVEPTREMLAAGDQKTWVLPSRDCYAAMLAAAPTPPAGERKPLEVAYPADMTSFNARMVFKAGWQSSERTHGIGVTNAD